MDLAIPVAWANDTTDAAAAMQIAVYRRVGGAERVAAAFRLSALVRATTMAGIRRRHPDYDEPRVQRAYGRLVLGDVLMRQVFPDRELVDP